MTKLEKQIRKVVNDHYAALSKKNDWLFHGNRVFGFRAPYVNSLDGKVCLEFCIHEGGQADHIYRWIDDADVLLPKIKKLTNARHIAVGCCGDNSQEGGITVSCSDLRVTKKERAKAKKPPYGMFK